MESDMKNERNYNEAKQIVRNTFNTTVFFGFTVMIFVFSMLSSTYHIVFWVCIFAFILYSFSSRVLALMAPFGSWFFYCYYIVHIIIFTLMFFVVFSGIKDLVFLVMPVIFIYNALVSARWRELQALYSVSDDDIFKN